MMEHRNAAHNAGGSIDLEYNHPNYGWIPFTASPDDPEQLGRDLYALALMGEVAPLVPPLPPTPEELRASMPFLNRAQLLLALHSIGVSEAMVDVALEHDPAGMIEWKNRPTYLRLHHLVVSMAVHFGLPEDQVDALWLWAVGL